MFSIGAFAIIFNEQNYVLLSHRRDMDLWNLPGGGIEIGELPTEAVVREVKEETGLNVVVERLVGVYGKTHKPDELVFAFECRAVSGEIAQTDEADENAFFEISEIPFNTSPKDVEVIHHAMVPDTRPIFCRQTGPSSRDFLKKLG
jgi:mutator protein MutT